MKLEEFMKNEGWVKTEETNYGRIYTSWIKKGFMIDEDDITKVGIKEVEK